MSTKYIFVSGGVISGLGKGIVVASIATILQNKGFRVYPIKCENYLNIDAGTIRPQEHGEIFVCDDGFECDQDIGTYERFLDISLDKNHFITMGQIYKSVIERERALEYDGEDVEAIPHICEEIIRRIKPKKKTDVVIIELGGTVGEYQNVFFYEAARIMKYKLKDDVLHIHVAYLPIPKSLGELKTKTVQNSVRTLSSMGIQPDFIVCRAEKNLDKLRKEKISLFCNVDIDDVISCPDVDSIYKIPLLFSKQKFVKNILTKLKLKNKEDNLKEWELLVDRINKSGKIINIGMVGKYYTVGDYSLEDSYISVVEALKHAGWEMGVTTKITWCDSEKVEKNNIKILEKMDGIIVPQGWGSRGTEGMITAARFARENNIPYLGLCFGMQMMVIEFARNVCGLKDANSTEVDIETKYPVIHIMPDQKQYLANRQYGGTIRLGVWPCKLEKGTKTYDIYKKHGQIKGEIVQERHRHRYEVNNKYLDILKKNGLIITGTSPDGKLVESVELPGKFAVGTQFHPEYISRPLKPHPLFLGFVEACLK